MSDTVNITIQVFDQVSATISTVGTQGTSGSQIMVDQTNDARTGIWVLDDNDIYLDKTVAQDTTRTGPYVDFDLMVAQGYVETSAMQAAPTKTTHVDADGIILIDSADSNAIKRTLWSAVKATLKTYFDTLYGSIARSLPAGGTTGQVLAKSSGTDYAVSWTTVASGGGTWGSITGTLSSQADLQTALDAKQPIDSDLTAIAALATTTFGRGLLTQADASATRSTIGLGAASSPSFTGLTLSGTLTASALAATTGAFSGTVTVGSSAGGGLLLTNATGTQGRLNYQNAYGIIYDSLETNRGHEFRANGTTIFAIGGTGGVVLGGSSNSIQTAGGGFVVNGTASTVTLASGWALGNANTTQLLFQNSGVIQQRAGTNSQTYELYGTYTDASNYRRLRLSSTTAGAFAITAEGLGTGASGNTLTIPGNVTFGASGQSNVFTFAGTGSNTYFDVLANGFYVNSSTLNTNNQLAVYNAGYKFVVNATGLRLPSGTAIGFSSTADAFGTLDLSLSRLNSTTLRIGTAGSNANGSLACTNITASGTATLGIYTVGTLPSASANPYAEANVSDASTPVMGMTVASGGSVKTKVRSNGTNWTVCGI